VVKPTLDLLFRNRLPRVLAIWALVLVQAQLLWVTEIHHHDEDSICRAGTVLTRDEQSPGPGVTEQPRCLACRVASESTALPVAGFLEAAPGTIIYFCPPQSPRHVHSSPCSDIPARAPPSR
jgi:hypothetical protein